MHDETLNKIEPRNKKGKKTTKHQKQKCIEKKEKKWKN